jgi:hypothetical protein
MRIGLQWWGVVALAALLSTGSIRADEPKWEAVEVGPGKIAVPKGWRDFDGMQPNMPLYRQGDGIGVPTVDETDAPLQMGLTAAKFAPAEQSVAEIMEVLVERAKQAPGLELVGKESVEDVKLADGVAGKLLIAEFLKGTDRRSLQMKLVVQEADRTTWIVSGHVVGGKDSQWPKADSKYAKWLRAHLTSLSLDPTKFDAERIEAAHDDLVR